MRVGTWLRADWKLLGDAEEAAESRRRFVWSDVKATCSWFTRSAVRISVESEKTAKKVVCAPVAGLIVEAPTGR